jgi:hypothetical protein
MRLCIVFSKCIILSKPHAGAQSDRSLPLPLCLPEPHAGAAVIFGQEFDTGLFEGTMDCLDSWFRHYAAAPFKIHNR